jgi:hypothetical protein
MKFHSMLAYALVLGPLAAHGAAQEKPAEAGKPKAAEAKPAKPAGPSSQRLIQIKNVDMIDELRELAKGFGPVSVYTSRELGVMVLTGVPDAVAAAQQAVEKFDVARPKKPGAAAAPVRNVNADFTAYLLLAKPEGEPARVPEALTPVVEQLQAAFPYKRYEVLETIALRVRQDGHGEVSGMLPSSLAAAKIRYKLFLDRVRIEPYDTGSSLVRVGQFRLNVEIPTAVGANEPVASYTYQNVGLNTGMDLRPNQKVVVGKVSPDGTNSSLIVVLTAKVAE